MSAPRRKTDKILFVIDDEVQEYIKKEQERVMSLTGYCPSVPDIFRKIVKNGINQKDESYA